MKKIIYFFTLILGLIFLSSCEERTSNIYKTPTVTGDAQFEIDTQYNESISVDNFDKNVLIEDFTGAACVNCPAAHKKAEDFYKANPNRINIVVYHSLDGALGKVAGPLKDSKYDFRTTFGTNLGKAFVVNKLPQWGINRKIFTGESTIAINSSNSWDSYINQELLEKSPIEIRVASKLFNETDSTFSCVFKAVHAQNMNDTLVASAYFIESEIEDKQEVVGGEIEYIHNEVFREAKTPENGVLITAPRKKGDLVCFKLKTKIPAKYNVNHLKMVMVISRNGLKNKEVLQSKVISLL